MDSPKKAVQLSKAVLNVTTYKPHPGNEYADVGQYVSIDITDLLEKNGVDSVYQINGVSSLERDCVTPPVPEEDELHTLITVSTPESELLEKQISDIIDAAIVNEKQGKAIKRLIHDKFDDFNSGHWAPIKKCDFVKKSFDELFEKELNGKDGNNS